ASGGMETDLGEDHAIRLNRDAQVHALAAGLEHLSTGGRVVFVTSHQAHFIHELETMPEYDAVARSKRAGEDALTEQLPAMSEKAVSCVVVSGDMIEGTVTATLLNRARPGALEARREAAGRLYSVEEFASEVAAMATADVPTGHVELVGGADDFLARTEGEACAISSKRPGPRFWGTGPLTIRSAHASPDDPRRQWWPRRTAWTRCGMRHTAGRTISRPTSTS